MNRKMQFLTAIFINIVVLSACSDNFDNDKLTSNISVDYSESCSYVASEASCQNTLAKSALEDSIEIIKQKDGSFVLRKTLIAECPEVASVSKVSIENKSDTLFVSIDYDYVPADTIITVNDSLGTVDTTYLPIRRRCVCFSNFEINIPVKFSDAKYLTFGKSEGTVFNIVYRKQD